MPPVAIESALRCDNSLDAYGASWPLLDPSEGWADSMMMLDHSSTDGDHLRSDSRNETMTFFYTMAKSSPSQTQEVGAKFGHALEAMGDAETKIVKTGQTNGITPSQRVKMLPSRPKPRCWEHGCSGREFATFSLLLRHQRGMAAKSAVHCPSCNASFARSTTRNRHLLHDTCKQHQCDVERAGLETYNAVSLEGRAAQPTSDTENLACSKLRAVSRLNSLSIAYREKLSLTQDRDVDTDESCETTTSPGSTCFDSEDEPGPLPLSERKRLLLDKLMVFFYSILSEGSLRDSYQSRGSGAGYAPKGHQGQGSHSSSGQDSSLHHSLSTSPNDFRTQGKRTFDRDDEDERDGKRPRASDSSKSDNQADSDAKLVCPFFRRNPERYQQQRSCLGPGWGTVHRVKEHVYRRHALPISCPRCCQTFENDRLKDEHITATDRCEPRGGISLEGMDTTQKELLRSRKKSQKYMTEGEKWREMYLILFPDTNPAELPSPYYEAAKSLQSGSTSPGFSRYEQFLRQELPVRVRQQLEVRIDQYLNPVEENLKNELVTIVRDMQIQLFDLYKSTQMVSADNVFTQGSSSGRNNKSLPVDIGRISSSASQKEDFSRPFNPSLYIDEELTSFDLLDGVLYDFDGMQQANSIETDSSYDQMSSEGMENELISSDELLDYEVL